MDIKAFLTSHAARQRYWAGGHRGYQAFSATEPNPSHRAIARFERSGDALGVITQNVDGLHLKAGSEHVVELHGTARNIICTECGQVFDRRDISDRIESANPWLLSAPAAELGPDGDSIPENVDQFVVPECTICGGILRPDVVFFGESVPKHRVAVANNWCAGADALLVAGSSLTVMSGLRFARSMAKQGKPVIIINHGATRADDLAAVRLDMAVGQALARLSAEV